MNVKVDFTLCSSLDCVIDVATVRTDTHQHTPTHTHTHTNVREHILYTCKHTGNVSVRHTEGHIHTLKGTGSNTCTYSYTHKAEIIQYYNQGQTPAFLYSLQECFIFKVLQVHHSFKFNLKVGNVLQKIAASFELS